MLLVDFITENGESVTVNADQITVIHKWKTGASSIHFDKEHSVGVQGTVAAVKAKILEAAKK